MSDHAPGSHTGDAQDGVQAELAPGDGDDAGMPAEAQEAWQRRVQEAILRGDLVSPLAMPRAKPPKWTDLIGMDPGYISDARPNPVERLTAERDEYARAGLRLRSKINELEEELDAVTLERDRTRATAARLEAELAELTEHLNAIADDRDTNWELR